MSKVIELADKHVKPIIEDLGFEVVDIEYQKKHEQMNLTIFIDIPRGVNLDDCEKVHHAINPILDEINPTGDTPYVLNVSSPGLDRPFKKQRDFERNFGREIEIKLYAPLKGKKLFEGVLIDRDDNTITLKTSKEEIKFENSKVAIARPLVKFE